MGIWEQSTGIYFMLFSPFSPNSYKSPILANNCQEEYVKMTDEEIKQEDHHYLDYEYDTKVYP